MNNYPVQLFKKNKQDGECWKGLGLPVITCLFLVFMFLLSGFLSFQRCTSWVPKGYLKAHFRRLSEMMTEECDVGCCGHVIHLHVWRRINFTGGMRKTTAMEWCMWEAGATSHSCSSLLVLAEGKTLCPKPRLVLGTVAAQEGMSLGWSSKRAVATSQRGPLEQPSKAIGLCQRRHTRALTLWPQAPGVLHPKSGKRSCQGARMSKTTAPKRNPRLAETAFPCELVTNAGEETFAMIPSFAVLIIPLTLFFFREQSLLL